MLLNSASFLSTRAKKETNPFGLVSFFVRFQRIDWHCRRQDPVRIPRPKIDKLACQAQGVGIFAP